MDTQMFESAFNSFLTTMGNYIPSLVAGLLVLVLGWFVALVISSAIGSLFRKLKVGDWLGDMTGCENVENRKAINNSAKTLSFYLLMAFVLIAFFEAIQLTIITEPLNNLLNQVFAFVPQLLGSIALLVLAWVIATIARRMTSGALSLTNLDEKLTQSAAAEGQSPKVVPVSNTLSETVYWLVFLLFLPAAIDALGLQGLLKPVNDMVSKISGFLPNLFSAGIILAAGWFVARVVQNVTTNLLASMGADRLGERLGLATALGDKKLSSIMGFVVYALILLPVLISALDTLGLEAVSGPAKEMLTTALNAVPSIFAALVVLAFGYAIGKMVSTLVSNVLTAIGFNRVLVWLRIGKEEPAGSQTPSVVMGTIAFAAVMIFSAMEAFNLLGFETMSMLLAEFFGFGSQILVGLVILGVGMLLANLAYETITASALKQSQFLGYAAKASILVLAGAMGLKQMGLGQEIISLTFGLLLGSIAIGLAIAFGVGGRHVAARELETWVDSIKKEKTLV